MSESSKHSTINKAMTNTITQKQLNIRQGNEILDRRHAEEIKEVFELYDTEKKNTIQGTNMKILLKTLGIEITTEELEDMLKSLFNKPLSASFKFEEFNQIAKRKFAQKTPEEELEGEFLLLCDYKEGDLRDKESLSLTKETFVQLIKNVGELMTEDEIDEIFSTVAGDEDNITKQSFVEFMKDPIGYKCNNSTIQ